MKLLHIHYIGGVGRKRRHGYLKIYKTKTIRIGSIPREISEKIILLYLRENKPVRQVLGAKLFSVSSVLCVLCIPFCCCPTTRLHKVTGHKEGDTEKEWRGPACLYGNKKGDGGWWSHKSAWAGLREFEGQWFTGSNEGATSAWACTEELLSGFPTTTTTIDTSCFCPSTKTATRIPASGNTALWSPLMEDVWLLCSLLNLGSNLQGCLCNPNITGTWRRWKAEKAHFLSRTLTAYICAEMCHNNSERPLRL